jgi:Fanconi anemia group M protein
MPFFDIFSRKKEKQQEKIKIIADYREKNSCVISELVAKGVEVEMRNLAVADFVIGETAVERKTVSDFIGSMINKRLFRQLEEIKQYKNYFLIIEGDFDNVEFGNKNAVRGMLLAILTEYRVPILYSKDEKETAEFIFLLAKKEKKEPALRASRIFLNKKEGK